MNLSPQTIEIHFKEVLAISEKIKRVSEELERIGQEVIPEILCETKRRWNSEAARKLVERELKMGNEYCNAARCLGALAAELSEQAQEIYKTEMCNLTLASTRIY